MAHADNDALFDLLQNIEFDSQAVRDMLEALANGETDPLPTPEDDKDEAFRQEFGVYIDCPDELTQTELLDRLLEEGYTCRALIS